MIHKILAYVWTGFALVALIGALAVNPWQWVLVAGFGALALYEIEIVLTNEKQ